MATTIDTGSKTPSFANIFKFDRSRASDEKPNLVMRKLIFSDIDGTLVHIADDALQHWGRLSEDGLSFTTTEGQEIEVRPLPPSSTGTLAFISERTLQLVAKIRQQGHLFVLISGARSSTVLERLPFLPAADAYVTENGGRIFVPAPSHSALTATPIVEDLQWRGIHVAAPVVLESVPPSQRPGTLWDLFRKLEREGWTCDANKYSTDFRVSVKKSQGKTEADLRLVIDALPTNLACSFNLGSADFYPATSGKDKAAKYLMKALGQFDKDSTVSMGDDDNDLALAKVVGHTYIPGFTAESVRTAVQEEPQAFTVAKHGAFLGTHEVLELIGAFGASGSWQWRPLWGCLLAASVAAMFAHRRHRRF